MFNLPISVKAVSAAVTATVITWLEAAIHVDASTSLRGVIAGAIGLAVAWLIPEGAKYVNQWIKRYGVPVEIDPEA